MAIQDVQAGFAPLNQLVQLLVQQKNLDADRAFRQAQLAETIRSNRVQEQHQADQLAIQKASNAIANIQALQGVQSNMYQLGISPPGMQVSQNPVIPGTEGAIPGVPAAPQVSTIGQTQPQVTFDQSGLPQVSQVANPNAPPAQQEYTIPQLGTSFVGPSMKDWLRQQADKTRILQQPVTEAQLELAKAQSDIIEQREKNLNAIQYQQQLNIAALTNAYGIGNQQRTFANQKELENIRRNTELDVARMQNFGILDPLTKTNLGTDADGNAQISTVPGVSQSDLNDMFMRAKTGRMSYQDLKERFPKPGQLKLIMDEAGKQGFVFPDQKIINSLDGLNQIAQILPVARQALDLANNHWFQLSIPASQASKDFKELTERLRAAAPAISKTTTGVNRFSNTELGRFDNFLIPETGFGSAMLGTVQNSNFQRFKQFTDLIQSEINQDISKLPQEQQKAVINQMEASGLPYAGRAVTAPGTQPPTPKGFTPPVSPSGKAQMFKYKKPEDLTGKIPDAPMGSLNIIRNGKILTVPMSQATDTDEIIPSTEPK